VRPANVDYLDVSVTRANAKFVEPMLPLAAESLPEGLGWRYELKLDGIRAIAIKSGGKAPIPERQGLQWEVSGDCVGPRGRCLTRR